MINYNWAAVAVTVRGAGGYDGLELRHHYVASYIGRKLRAGGSSGGSMRFPLFPMSSLLILIIVSMKTFDPFINDYHHHHHYHHRHQLQTSVTWVVDELERNQNKENHLNTIFKMMGTLVQVQLYTFSSRMALYWPQKWPKITVWG